MSLANLEALIAVEDAPDDAPGLLRWLEALGLLDARRVIGCSWCGKVFVARNRLVRRFCSDSCSQAAFNWRGDPATGPGQACRSCRAWKAWACFPKHPWRERFYRFCFDCRAQHHNRYPWHGKRAA